MHTLKDLFERDLGSINIEDSSSLEKIDKSFDLLIKYGNLEDIALTMKMLEHHFIEEVVDKK